MPVGFTVRYPIVIPPDLSTSMIFKDGEFVIANISRNTDSVITFAVEHKNLRPVPLRRKEMPTETTYIAQDICNKDEFEDFYKIHRGKSIKMDFEGHTYYGYLSKFVRGEFDITFSFTYTSKIEHIEEDDGFFSR